MASAEAIPRRIHYCWFGRAPISELGQHCIQTWRDVLPDYEMVFWNDAHLDRRNPYVDTAYRSGKLAFVADYVRFQALYEHGGLYFDTDVEVIRPFDRLLGLQLFFGLQAPDSIGAGVIGAVKGHPFLKLALERLDAEGRSGKLTYRPLPDLVTQLTRANPSVAPSLLPEECCYPYNPFSPAPLRRKPLQSHISDRTLCIHHWEGTWLDRVSLRDMLRVRMEHAMRRIMPWRRERALVAAPQNR